MFNPCPALKNQPLPFDIDELGFLKWLKSFSPPNGKANCEQLLQVLHTLNHTDVGGKTRLLFLEKLGALLFQLSSRQTKLAFSQNTTLTPDDPRPQELIVWCCAALAQGYTLLSKADDFKDNKTFSLQQKSLIISHGIQAMSKALLYISQSYKTPYPHFWRKCFEFYQLGQEQQLTDVACPGVDPIDNVFKHLLIFSLSNSNQFSQLEMSVIYDLLGQYAGYAKLVSPTLEQTSGKLPVIFLDQDAPPSRHIADHKPTALTLHIATAPVAVKLIEAIPDNIQYQPASNRLMLLRLAKTLALHQPRKQRRERVQGVLFGIIGFDSVINFLHGNVPGQKSQLSKNGLFEMTHSAQLGNLNYTIAKTDDEKLVQYNLKLKRSGQTVNAKTFKIIQFTDPAEIWKTDQMDRMDQFEANIVLIDKSKKGYGLHLTNRQLKPQVGHLIGLNYTHNQVGVIRWIMQDEESRLLIGVELLGNQAQAVRISNPGFPNFEADAIYLPADAMLEQAETLVLLNGAFNPAEFFFMYKDHRNIRFRLIKILHSTSLIRHFEIARA